uniref:Small-subunit processome, Utp14 n=1 Tax=Macrostomum lignano TaxID=282301 RepID=A0A1I8FWL8_9PLAT
MSSKKDRRRGRSPVIDGASQGTSAAAEGPAPISAQTLKLFTVPDDSAAATAEEPKSARDGGIVSNKNPRWLLQREKELRSEAIRERMLQLVSQIELEEARDKPAKRKAWLHEKKMELRRLIFKQPDEIIAGEDYMKRARRKLREARRRRREKNGAGSNDEEEEGDDDGEALDDSSSSGGDEGSKKKSDKDKKKRSKTEGATAKATSSRSKKPERNGASGGRRSSGEDTDNADADENDEDESNGGVFNLNPTGRLSRRNPRSPVPGAEPEELSKRHRSFKKMGKVIRFPIESGYKLGNKIRKHREKRKASSAHGSGDGDCASEWGERVDSGQQRRLNRRRRSSTSDADLSLSRRQRDDGVCVIVTNDSDGANSDADRSSRSGNADNIPELQESVGKKIRDKLTIRRPRWRSRNSGSEGSDAEDGKGGGALDDDKSENDGEKEKSKKKKKKEKEKNKDSGGRKEKDKAESTKTKKGASAEDANDVQPTDKEKKAKKKDKKQKKSKEKDNFEPSTAKQSGAVVGKVNEALEFVELESD